MTPVTLPNVPGPRLEVQGGRILYCGWHHRTVKQVRVLTKPVIHGKEFNHHERYAPEH
jgi:hypothetical protein